MRVSILLVLLDCFAVVSIYAQGRPPVIAQQPTNQLASLGSDVVFAVSAAPSVTPLRYQWFKDDISLPGATESILTLNKVTEQSAGSYSVSIVNAAGSITSNKATLSLLELKAVSFSVGDTAVLGESLPRAPNWFYQWYFNRTIIENATNSCLYLTNVQTGQMGYYTVSISSDLGSGQLSTYLDIDPSFTRIIQGAPENFMADNRGGVWGDINNDRYLDLFLPVRTSGENLFYINNGNETFSLLMTHFVKPETVSSRSASFVDFDNDGYLDLFVGNTTGISLMYRNQGNGLFSMMSTNQLGQIAAINTDAAGCLWGDYNNDGFLDLFLTTGRFPPNQIWFNNAGKNFSMALLDSTFSEKGGSFGAASGDFDNDGYLDLLVCNLNESSTPVLYHNQGNGAFSRIHNTSVSKKSMVTTSGILGDFDNNGYLDLFIPNWSGLSQQNTLFSNDGKGTFIERMEDPIVKEGGFSPSACWGDYDNDGFLDLFVVNCGYNGSLLGVFNTFVTNNFLYHNNGDLGTFTKVTSGGPVNVRGQFTCASFADYNSDGYLDLFLTYSFFGNDLLYRNNGNSNGWIVVNCEGRISNKFGVGAKVRAKAFYAGKERWQMREITGGDGGYSSSPISAHFGLGDATKIDTIRIEWPSGIVQELRDVPIRQYLRVTEQGVGILPRHQELTVNSPLSLKAQTTLTSPIYYQWRYQGTNIDNATNDILYIASPQSENAGEYTVAVSNNNISWISSEVLVTLPGPPVISRQPGDQNAIPGSQVVFRVTVLTGVSPVRYQWQFNGIDLLGQTRDNLIITNVQPTDAGSYVVSVSNSAGTVSSTAANLIVVDKLPPEIVLEPDHQSALVGTAASWSVVAKGTEPFRYQWYFNNQPLASATSSVFSIDHVSVQNQGRYHVAISNDVGFVIGAGCWLNVVTQVPSGIFVSTFAGSGNDGSEDGKGYLASFSYPNGGFVDTQGFVYVVDGNGHKLRQVSPDGTVKTVAGNGNAGYVDGPGLQAQFNVPLGVCVTAIGEVLVADSGNNCIRIVRSDTSRTVATFSGNGISGYVDGSSAAARYGFPNDLVIDVLGNVFVTEFTNHVVRKIAIDGSVSTFVGNGTIGGANGIGNEARLNQPAGIAIGPDGMLYVTEWGGNWIRKITPAGDVTVFSGSGIRGFTDGPAATAQFNNPDGVVVDANGSVYVTEYSNHTIRKISPDGSVITLAGTGRMGYADGDGLSAQFANPGGIGLGPDGCLYIIDTGNRRIRKLQFFSKPQVLQQPQDISLTLGSGATFSVRAQGSQPVYYQWLLNGRNIPDATNTTLVIPSAQVEDVGAYSVRVSNVAGTCYSQVAALQMYRFLSLSKERDGRLRLELSDLESLPWRVEASEDFLQWSNIGSMMVTNQNTVLIYQPIPAQPYRFFRALTP